MAAGIPHEKPDEVKEREKRKGKKKKKKKKKKKNKILKKGATVI